MGNVHYPSAVACVCLTVGECFDVGLLCAWFSDRSGSGLRLWPAVFLSFFLFFDSRLVSRICCFVWPADLTDKLGKCRWHSI